MHKSEFDDIFRREFKLSEVDAWIESGKSADADK